MTPSPLSNRRILVTRGATQAAKLSDGLRILGAIPIEVPVIEIRPPDSYEPLDSALRNLSSYDWLIFTSTNSVSVFNERAKMAEISSHTAAAPQVAAVGEATAQAARDAGFTVSLVPESYVAESLVSALQDRMAGKRVLVSRAAVARDVIPDALRAAGATVDVVDAYQNAMPEAAPQQLRRAYAPGLDAVTFTSSSSVTHLARAAQAGGVPFPLKGVRAVSIGPITSQTLSNIGWPPAAEADPHDIPGLIAAVTRVLGR
jgi:uroporphyrinogen-III synthase/uroporphyrinogen III methyltransferase/synthase